MRSTKYMEDVMDDRPQAEACALEPASPTDTDGLAKENASPTLHGRVAEMLPRLTTVGTYLALAGPSIVSLYQLESLGSGLRGC